MNYIWTNKHAVFFFKLLVLMWGKNALEIAFQCVEIPVNKLGIFITVRVYEFKCISISNNVNFWELTIANYIFKSTLTFYSLLVYVVYIRKWNNPSLRYVFCQMYLKIQVMLTFRS